MKIIFLTILALLAVSMAVAENALPLAVGNRWEYSITQNGVMSTGEGEHSRSMPLSADGSCIEEVVSIKEQRKDGTVYEYHVVTKTEAGVNIDASEVVEDSLMLASDKGIAILASKASGLKEMLSNEWVSYNPPLMNFASGLKPGTTWRIGTVREGNLRMPMMGQVAGTETVTVPAGTFDDCLKIYVTCTRVTGSIGSGVDLAVIKSGKSVNIAWVHPNVGVVKEEDILQARMQFPTGPVMVGTEHKVKELLPGYRAQPSSH